MKNIRILALALAVAALAYLVTGGGLPPSSPSPAPGTAEAAAGARSLRVQPAASQAAAGCTAPVAELKQHPGIGFAWVTNTLARVMDYETGYMCYQAQMNDSGVNRLGGVWCTCVR